MKRAMPLLYLLILLLSGCAGVAPVVSGPAEEAASFPEAAAWSAELPPEIGPGEWTVRDTKHLTARVEFSDGDMEDVAVCGVSFFNAIKAPKRLRPFRSADRRPGKTQYRA